MKPLLPLSMLCLLGASAFAQTTPPPEPPAPPTAPVPPTPPTGALKPTDMVPPSPAPTTPTAPAAPAATPAPAPARTRPNAAAAPAATAPGSSRSGTTQLQTSDGPVTVTWGQPAQVPNISDYQAKVPDLDRNGDGVLSRAEVPASHALASEFRLVDRNRDGRISAAELANWR